jgi:hypothetical protein
VKIPDLVLATCPLHTISYEQTRALRYGEMHATDYRVLDVMMSSADATEDVLTCSAWFAARRRGLG